MPRTPRPTRPPRPRPLAAAALAAGLAILFPAAPALTQPEPAPETAPLPPEADRFFPDTPVGRRARAWYAAVRAGAPDAIEPMIRAQFDAAFLDRVPIENHVAMHQRLAAAGVALPHSIAGQTEHEIVYYIRDGGVWGQLRIRVNPDEPNGITDVGVRPSPPPPGLAGRPETMEALAAETAEFLDALHDAGRFDGVVIVWRAGTDAPVLRWPATGGSDQLPLGELAKSMRLVLPLRSGERRAEGFIGGSTMHPHDELLMQDPLEENSSGVRHAVIKKWQTKHDRLTTDIFSIDAEGAEPFLLGVLRERILTPARMSISTTLSQTTPDDLARFGEAFLDPYFLYPATRELLTTGTDPDLDPSPRVTRRAALGFEERIDHLEGLDVRSFSAVGGDEDTRVLLRCYPDTNDAVVIVARDERTLRLIDRRIFNRLPGLVPIEDDD